MAGMLAVVLRSGQRYFTLYGYISIGHRPKLIEILWLLSHVVHFIVNDTRQSVSIDYMNTLRKLVAQRVCGRSDKNTLANI